MGIQIHIEAADMKSAGWSKLEVPKTYWEQDCDDNDVEITYIVTAWQKGDAYLESYVPNCFVADCNAWGSNRALFKELGLMDLPHILS